MTKNLFSNIDWRIYFGSTGLFVGACTIGFIVSTAAMQNIF